MKHELWFVVALGVASVAVEAHASAQRLQWVQKQNAKVAQDDDVALRWEADGDTLVIIDDDLNQGAFFVSTIAMEPHFNRPILRAGFRFVRAGNFVEAIR